MPALLQTLGQWVVALACLASGYFVFATTFAEYHRHGKHTWGFRFQLFRWWRHELTAAQVVLDACLFLVMLPTMLVRVFGIDFLGIKERSELSTSYVICALVLVIAATLWRADATSRAKARERDHLRAEASAPLEEVGEDTDPGLDIPAVP